MKDAYMYTASIKILMINIQKRTDEFAICKKLFDVIIILDSYLIIRILFLNLFQFIVIHSLYAYCLSMSIDGK